MDDATVQDPLMAAFQAAERAAHPAGSGKVLCVDLPADAAPTGKRTSVVPVAADVAAAPRAQAEHAGPAPSEPEGLGRLGLRCGVRQDHRPELAVVPASPQLALHLGAALVPEAGQHVGQEARVADDSDMRLRPAVPLVVSAAAGSEMHSAAASCWQVHRQAPAGLRSLTGSHLECRYCRKRRPRSCRARSFSGLCCCQTSSASLLTREKSTPGNCALACPRSRRLSEGYCPAALRAQAAHSRSRSAAADSWLDSTSAAGHSLALCSDLLTQALTAALDTDEALACWDGLSSVRLPDAIEARLWGH